MQICDLFESSITDSPAFQRWFAGSQAVDAQGKPLKLYHGTSLQSTSVYQDGCNVNPYRVAIHIRL